MLCCRNCFNDEYLQKHIDENGDIGDCDFCGCENSYCIEPRKLEELLLPLAKLYEPIEGFMPMEDLKHTIDNLNGEFLWEKLASQWEYFNFEDNEKQEALTRAIFDPGDPKNPGWFSLDSYVEDPDDFWGDSYERDEKYQERWDEFCNEIRTRNRYFPVSVDILNDFGYLIDACEAIINEGETFFRARDCTKEGSKFLCEQMGVPPQELTKAGRGNPEGIPYLYIASKDLTAITEIKPYPGELVTVGKLKTTKELKLVDLTYVAKILGSPARHGDRLEQVIKGFFLIKLLSQEISKPINPLRDILAYLPTQYLCEFIKGKEYDGLIYQSSLTYDGYNVLLFSEENVKCIETDLFRITEVSPPKVEKQ